MSYDTLPQYFHWLFSEIAKQGNIIQAHQHITGPGKKGSMSQFNHSEEYNHWALYASLGHDTFREWQMHQSVETPSELYFTGNLLLQKQTKLKRVQSIKVSI